MIADNPQFGQDVTIPHPDWPIFMAANSTGWAR